jgi:asparagine synthetase B (glutamine-hydrolysing)
MKICVFTPGVVHALSRTRAIAPYFDELHYIDTAAQINNNVFADLPKKCMEKYLPDDIIYRNKQGFNIPVSLWVKGNLLNAVREKVLDGNLQKWGIVERSGIQKLVKLQSDSRHNFNNTLLLLLAFESWTDVYQSRVGGISFN